MFNSNQKCLKWKYNWKFNEFLFYNEIEIKRNWIKQTNILLFYLYIEMIIKSIKIMSNNKDRQTDRHPT